MLTKDNIVDRMMAYEGEDKVTLAESCYESHKDFYGVRGRHLLSYSVAELVSWRLAHFDWDYTNQLWTQKVPFIDEDRCDQH